MKYTKQDCIDGLRKAAEELGEPLGTKEYKDGDYSPSASTIKVRFGGWNEAKEAARLETSEFIQRGDTVPPDVKFHPEPEYTEQKCIDELQRAAEECDGPLEVEGWREGGYEPSDRTLADKFGSWNEAKEAAGLDTLARGENLHSGANRRTGALFKTDDRGYEIWGVHDWPTFRRVLVHRLVAVAEHGAEAVAGNVVHHENGCKFDNRPENLEVMTASEHMKLHWDQGDMYTERKEPSA